MQTKKNGIKNFNSHQEPTKPIQKDTPNKDTPNKDTKEKKFIPYLEADLMP